jgi:NAD(P)-dependent dehydrogenase (short-subunit alcohol dehydrogenase family)
MSDVVATFGRREQGECERLFERSAAIRRNKRFCSDACRTRFGRERTKNVVKGVDGATGSMPKAWLVTGSASGLGRSVAEAVLESGDNLVATARDPQRLHDLVEKYGSRVRTAALDVADETAAHAAVQVAVDGFGRLDVVVNNAGYGDVAPFEQLSPERFKAVIDTNFYGVVNVTRAALPIMRQQKRGCILQISSVGGRLALPGSTPYHAAKWAVGGFTESLALEVAPFGVRVCALEPGGMRTSWAARANKDTPDILPDYQASVGAVIRSLAPHWGHETSDPAKVARVILRLADSDHLPAHLLLGSDAVQYAGQAEAARAADAERWREVSLSTDVDSTATSPSLRFTAGG